MVVGHAFVAGHVGVDLHLHVVEGIASQGYLLGVQSLD
jgi:hypothetical protein